MPPSSPTRALAAAIVVESLRNISGSAAAAAMQERLANDGVLSRPDFRIAYAAARLTPGTNLIALYTALGHAVSGWRGALAAIVAGSLPSAVCAVLIGWTYERVAGQRAAAAGLEGAAIAGIAAIVWAAFTLSRPVVLDHRRRAGVVLGTLVALVMLVPLPPLAVIVLGGAAGALVLR